MSDSEDIFSTCETDESCKPYKSICITESSCSSSLSSVSCMSSISGRECKKKPKDYYVNPDICNFKSIITPLSELTPVCAKHCGPVEFTMRRKNRVVSLQWEPFSGMITTNGITHLTVAQTICNLPNYSVYGVYNLEYNGINRLCPIEINPSCVRGNILFYLNSNVTSENVNANDSVVIKGGYIAWIV